MDYSNYRFTLDLQSTQSQVSLPVKFGDTARRLYINITDGGIPYALEDGCKAVFSAKKADGKNLFNDCIIEKNTTVRYDFTEQTATAEGVTQCEIILYGVDNKVIGSARFTMVVDKRVVYDMEIVSEGERDAIDSLICFAEETKQKEEERRSAEELRIAAEEERIKAEEERKLRAKSDVGIETDEGGEVFNDYRNNRAGSRAFTIVGVERDNPVTDNMKLHGYGLPTSPTADEISAEYGLPTVLYPEYAFYSDFGNGKVSSYRDTDYWNKQYSADDESSYVTPYLEPRQGRSAIVDDDLRGKALAVEAVYGSGGINLGLQLVRDNVKISSTARKSFVFSYDIRLAGNAKLETDTLCIGEFTSVFANKTSTSSSLRCNCKTVFSTANGELYIFKDGVKSDANKKIIGRLNRNLYTNIAIFVRLEGSDLIYDVYLDGGKVVSGEKAIVVLNVVYTCTPDYGAGFALATASFTDESDKLQDGVYFHLDRVALYFTDSYKFGIGGAYELDSVDGLSVGDEYSVHVCYKSGTGHGSSEQVENYGKITAIEGNRVYVDKVFCNGEFQPYDSYEEYSEANVFRIISKPDVGTRLIGKHSHTGGRNSATHSQGGVSFGNGNKAHGSWSGTIGRALKAAYAAFAINSGNEALGQCSFAGGDRNVVEEQARCGVGLGMGNIVRLAYELIHGEYAKLDEPDATNGNRGKYLHKVGNGTDDAHRSDAYTLDREGNGVFAGDVTGKGGRLAYVDELKQAVAELVDSSPEALNTLNELAEALNNDEDFAAHMIAKHAEYDTKHDEYDTAIANMWKKIYPVGSIYMSVNSTSPSTLFGGTWVRIQDTFLLAAGASYSAGKTGGKKSIKLTEAHLPPHSHTFTPSGSVSTTSDLTGSMMLVDIDSNNIVMKTSGKVTMTVEGGSIGNINLQEGEKPTPNNVKFDFNHGHSFSGNQGTTSTYGTESEDVDTMPPYLAVYMWKRTA